MSRTSLEVKAKRKPKFSARAYNRCPLCGRSRAFLRQFGICRICSVSYTHLTLPTN